MEIIDIGFPPGSDDGSLKSSHYLVQWTKDIMAGAQQSGRPWTAPQLFMDYTLKAGFNNVTLTVKKLPQCAWPTDSKEMAIGQLCLPIHKAGHRRLGMDFLPSHMGWSTDEVESKLAEVLNEMEDTNIHTWWPM